MTANQDDYDYKRRFIRFKPDVGAYAQIDLKVEGEFEPTLIGLVPEEAYQGCGLVVLATEALQMGDQFRLAVGRAAPVLGEIRWRKDVGEGIIRLGVLYHLK